MLQWLNKVLDLLNQINICIYKIELFSNMYVKKNIKIKAIKINFR